MKLEDVKLQLGDKITFDDGFITFMDSDKGKENNIPSTWLYKNGIVKIERYVPLTDCGFDSSTGDGWTMTFENVYELETIWERKEILDKEELQKQLSEIQRECDLVENEIGEYHSLMHSARDKVGALKKRVSEIQSQITNI